MLAFRYKLGYSVLHDVVAFVLYFADELLFALEFLEFECLILFYSVVLLQLGHTYVIL